MASHFSLLPTGGDSALEARSILIFSLDIIEFLSMSIDSSVTQPPEGKVALNLLRLPHPRTGGRLTTIKLEMR